MQRTIVTKDGKLVYSNTPKRKYTEVSPEKMSAEGQVGLPGNLGLTDIVEIINRSIRSILDEKLVNLSTKDDIDGVKKTMEDCCSQIGQLKMENESLKEEVKILKSERKKDHQDLMRLVEKSKRKNVVFRGISKEGNLKENIKKICSDTMNIVNIEVK